MAHNPCERRRSRSQTWLTLFFRADLLETAVRKFRASLTPVQNTELLAHSQNKLNATTILAFTAEIDKINANRQSRCVSSRLFGILQSVQEFSSIADTFVSSNPEIAALVWGSLKFTILVGLLPLSYIILLTCSRPSIISSPSSTNFQKPSSASGLVALDTQNIRVFLRILYVSRKLCVNFMQQSSISARKRYILLSILVRQSFSQKICRLTQVWNCRVNACAGLVETL
jgi:hypothetical protein